VWQTVVSVRSEMRHDALRGADTRRRVVCETTHSAEVCYVSGDREAGVTMVPAGRVGRFIRVPALAVGDPTLRSYACVDLGKFGPIAGGRVMYSLETDGADKPVLVTRIVSGGVAGPATLVRVGR